MHEVIYCKLTGKWIRVLLFRTRHRISSDWPGMCNNECFEEQPLKHWNHILAKTGPFKHHRLTARDCLRTTARNGYLGCIKFVAIGSGGIWAHDLLDDMHTSRLARLSVYATETLVQKARESFPLQNCSVDLATPRQKAGIRDYSQKKKRAAHEA